MSDFVDSNIRKNSFYGKDHKCINIQWAPAQLMVEFKIYNARKKDQMHLERFGGTANQPHGSTVSHEKSTVSNTMYALSTTQG